MEDYIVSARKYRPMTFDAVVGQPALTTTLKNAVKSKKLAHAYLFCGPRGVGKTTCARIFAKAINCLNPTAEGEACNECESCKAFNEGRSYNIFELDAASNNKVEDIKALMDQTRIPPQVGKYKVFIIDEVHMLSSQAFNAFLKTLEEPPAHVIFILATTEKNKILPTIISRCQIYDFERMTVPEIINHLKMVAGKEGIQYEEEALNVIAEKADGGMRDALSIFDQAASFSQGNITYEKVLQDLNVLDSENYFRIIDLALQNKVSDIMLLLNGIIGRGFDGGNLINGLASHVRNVLMAKDESTLPLLETSDRQRGRFKEQAKRCSANFLYKALQIMNQCDVNYRQSSNKRLLVELTLIEVAQITQSDGDDKPGAGRRPKRLKILFKNLMASAQAKPVQQVAGLRAQVHQRPQTIATAVNRPAAQLGNPLAALGQGKVMTNFGFTFKSILGGGKQTESNHQQAAQTGEESSFTQEQLNVEWVAMCNEMAQELRGMSARLKNMIPQITNMPVIELAVDNDFLKEEIEKLKPNLSATLRKRLHNSKLQISLRIAAKEEVKVALTGKQLFDKMRKDNASIEHLRTAFNLELS